MTDTNDTVPETRMFHLGDILTITTGIMVTPNGVGGIYDILGWMTGEQLFTHQLPRASGQCEPILKEMYPGIAKVEVPDASKIAESQQAEFWQAWLDVQIEQFGKELPVPKLKTHTPVDPILELNEMMAKKGHTEPPIILVVDPDSIESEIKYVVDRVINGD